MKQNLSRIAYWLSTGLFSIMMAYSAYRYLTEPMFDQAFTHLGYPAYFRVELAVAKFLGAAALLLPISGRLKEWAYAGFTFTLLSGFISHATLGDPINYTIMPLVFGVVLAISYLTRNSRSLEVTSKAAYA
jgi:hypothetical protein